MCHAGFCSMLMTTYDESADNTHTVDTAAAQVSVSAMWKQLGMRVEEGRYAGLA